MDIRIRSRKDNRAGYVVGKAGSKLLVTWDKEDGVSIVSENDVVVHEDACMIAAMCDLMCNFQREEE